MLEKLENIFLEQGQQVVECSKKVASTNFIFVK